MNSFPEDALGLPQGASRSILDGGGAGGQMPLARPARLCRARQTGRVSRFPVCGPGASMNLTLCRASRGHFPGAPSINLGANVNLRLSPGIFRGRFAPPRIRTHGGFSMRHYVRYRDFPKAGINVAWCTTPGLLILLATTWSHGYPEHSSGASRVQINSMGRQYACDKTTSDMP